MRGGDGDELPRLKRPTGVGVRDVCGRAQAADLPGVQGAAAGADAVGLTPPHYFVNNQEELLTHYRVIREKVNLPVFIYNIPQMTKARLEAVVGRELDGAAPGSGENAPPKTKISDGEGR